MCWELVGFICPSKHHWGTTTSMSRAKVLFAAVFNYSEYHKDEQLCACVASGLFKGGSCAEAVPYDWWGDCWYLAKRSRTRRGCWGCYLLEPGFTVNGPRWLLDLRAGIKWILSPPACKIRKMPRNTCTLQLSVVWMDVWVLASAAGEIGCLALAFCHCLYNFKGSFNMKHWRLKDEELKIMYGRDTVVWLIHILLIHLLPWLL